MRRASRLAISTCLAVSLFAVRADAYNEAVHASLTRRAFAGRDAWLEQPLAAPSDKDLADFRARFWTLAANTGDASLRADFLARFPNASALDAWSFKEFLMLDPAKTVHGLDDAPGPEKMTRGSLLPLASRWPDDDQRNRDRFQRDAQRKILRDDHGDPLPYDPATLSLGGIQGTSSQGHAHYGLLKGPFSDDPKVLKEDPRHFAIPPDAQSWGAQFAQIYTDLAIVAAQSQIPSRGWMAATFSGASFHHLEDVSNQIHTIQVGIFDFFEAAFLQSKLRDLETLGGLLGPRKSLKVLGLQLVSNHHLLLEDLFAKRVLEEEQGKEQGPTVSPELREALTGLDKDDPDLAQAAHALMKAPKAPPNDGFIEALAYQIIDRSSFEGPECYRLIWNISAPVLHKGDGYPYDGAKGDDPDNFVVATGAAGQEILGQFYTLEAKGLHRATTAVRLWQESFDAESTAKGADQRAVDRILREVLPYHKAAAQRRIGWKPASDSAENQIAWGYPLVLAALLAIAFLLFIRFSRLGDPKPGRR